MNFLNKMTSSLTLKSIDQQGYFCGYASVFNEVDDQGDQIIPGAFQHSLKIFQTNKTQPKMLWQHDFKEPIGVWEDLYEDQYGLFVKGKLILDLYRAQEVYALMKAGILDSLSIGYRVVKATKGSNLKIRNLCQVDLFEISLVTFPANQSAKITSFKTKEESCDFLLIQKLNKAIEILKS